MSSSSTRPAGSTSPTTEPPSPLPGGPTPRSCSKPASPSLTCPSPGGAIAGSGSSSCDDHRHRNATEAAEGVGRLGAAPLSVEQVDRALVGGEEHGTDLGRVVRSELEGPLQPVGPGVVPDHGLAGAGEGEPHAHEGVDVGVGDDEGAHG